MASVVLLAVVCLASISLSATSVPFKQGRCAMQTVRHKRPANGGQICTKNSIVFVTKVFN